MMLKPEDRTRLQTAPNIWLASVRANGTPHLVPIWFVWLDDKLFFCTARQSVKARNIRANPSVALALEDGNDPVVLEGEAKILEDVPDAVAQSFKQKYDWNIHGDDTYDAVIEITPQRVLL